ncbi:MAG: GHKL domain-containing protein [Clostridia bacterium]|nr:GHKL domain-containing protein [Clostridia bacterium]
MENDALKEFVEKEKIMYEEYTLLNEQYEQMRAFRHDIKEHLGVLNSLIDENSQEAKEYIRDICETEGSIPFSKFSNNKILNILLSKKKNECKLKGIDFYIDPIRADLSFLQDMDVVTVFSNLINNTLDSCEKSVEKKIFLNISTTNECFTVIKIENSCDIKPIVINAKLKTTKADESMHGIGMNNIRKALKKYNGLLQWDYSEERKIFSVTILINRLKI